MRTNLPTSGDMACEILENLRFVCCTLSDDLENGKPYDDSLCCVLEDLLLDGVKCDRDKIWQLLQAVSHHAQIDFLQTMENLSSHAGFSRAWVRVMLNCGAIGNALQLISTELKYPTPEWTAVERDDVSLPWDLEGTPLQIKTNSTLGSNEFIRVGLYDTNSTLIGTVNVRFTSPMEYFIGRCFYYTDLPVQPPVEVEKIWTITKTNTTLNITCNNVEVVNYLFADSSDARCVPLYGGDVVEEIRFNNADTASDFYRAPGK
eukprot:sb/3468424/